MEESEEIQARQRASEAIIVQRKLDRVNESLKGITIEQIREVAAQADKESKKND
ncbi:hypothetical protein [Persicitalea sp.]|uniref:hypothetical protein n=1 Tax=Persicitalea sp. TaxID=3100273 RepID=UPI003594942A